MTIEEAHEVLVHCVKMGVYAYLTTEDDCPVTVYGVGMMECYEDEIIRGSGVEIFIFDDAMQHMARLIDKGVYYQYPDGKPFQAQSIYYTGPEKSERELLLERNTVISER